ncbi:unnamed protein product [Lymnaea stagnalis]|uniref:Major facilitator superfamily (MFS) profile domain-containing protein n=1 Tax=Lymnaea stagnalis TaxID=6523 RepID=A0AAV2H220_LYMST
MSHLGEQEKLVNDYSSERFIDESDSDEPESDHLIQESRSQNVNDINDKVTGGSLMKPSQNVEENPHVNGNYSSPSTISPGSDDLGSEKSSNKFVKFFGGKDIYDLKSTDATPVVVSLKPLTSSEDQMSQDNNDCNTFSDDSPAILDLGRPYNTTEPISSGKDNDSTSPSDSNEAKSPSTVEPSEQGGHKHFDVTNVDESALKTENEVKDQISDIKSESQRPSLLKVASSTSDGFSGQSNISYNQDTIGPLDNPDFLKRLQYSVSQAVDDDGFGTGNLDLDEFAGETQQTVPDMDGGWAWVVLFAAFCSLALTGATTFTAGVLMSAILEQIEDDITKASWIGAVHVSVLCMSGPFVGIVLSRLGSRWTVFCAGLILSSGLIGASFATTIGQLIISHGLVAGMGSGFILNTMFVTVGQYFNRYRGLACGLLATGSGAGMLAGGNALNLLFKSYGLSGTYLLWGGITCHTMVFGLLLRPSPEERLREAEKQMAKEPERFNIISQQDLRSGRNSVISGLNSQYSGGDQQSIFSGGPGRKLQRYPSKHSKGDLSVAPLLKAVLHKEMSRSSYSVATNRSRKSQKKSAPPASPSTGSKFTFGPANPANDASGTSTPGATPMSHNPHTFSPFTSQDQGDQASPNKKLGSQNQESVFLSSSTLGNTNIPESDTSSVIHAPSSPSNSQAPTEYGRSFRRRLLSQSSQAQSQYSISRLSQRPSIREQLQRNDLDNESLASTLVSHLQPRDALTPRHRLGSRSISSMMGSISSFPTALAIVKDDLSRLENVDGPMNKTIEQHLSALFDSLRLLKHKSFLVFITTSFLWAFGESPFTMYLPAYSISKGTSVTQASSLYTGMGFGSMCGRFLSGLVASDSGVGPILLHIGCLSIGGLVIALSPFISDDYTQQMICAGLFGLYTGSLVPLSSLITIELLGIGELGLGFGFLSLFQGVGYLLGPPVGGVFVKLVGYGNALSISGCIVLSASLLAMTIPILLRNSPEIEDDHDSLDDLERALRRISASDDGDGSDEETSTQDEQGQKLLLSGSQNLAAVFKKKDDGQGGPETSPRDASVTISIKEDAHEVIPEEKPSELPTIVEEAEKKSLGGDLE